MLRVARGRARAEVKSPTSSLEAVGSNAARRSRRIAVAAAAICLLALLPTTPALSGPAGVGRAPALLTDARPVPSGVPTAPLAPSTPLDLVVTMASKDPAGLSKWLAAVEDPSSPSYRHYLTHAEVLTRYGPDATARGAVEAYFEGFGASGFSTTSDGFGLSFSIPAGGASRALGVGFVEVSPRAGAPLAYTAVGRAALPGPLAASVSGLGGLSDTGNSALALSLAAVGPRDAVAGPAQFVTDGTSGLNEPWFFGSDFTSAYQVSSLFPPSSSVANATFPTKEAIATLLMSGYNASTQTNLPPFDPVVVDGYFNDTFPAAWPHPTVTGVPVPIGGITPPAPGYFGGVNDTTSNSVENCLDLEMAGSLAPGATLVNFYFPGSLLSAPSTTVTNGDLADAFAETLAAALSYNYSNASLAAVSASFGLPDLNDSLWNTEIGVAAAMGVTIVAASGDQGNAPTQASGRFQGQWPTWPATATFATSGAVAVGGLTPTLTGSPTAVYNGSSLNATFDPTVTGVASASAWYDTLGGYGNLSGTEGGVSPVYPEPSWQFHSAAQPAIVNATVTEGLSQLGRAEPDVAFPANTTVAYIWRNLSGTYFQVLEGTSVAAPVLAGFLASAAAVAGHRFGFLDPELYRMGSYYEAYPSAPSNPFEDVVTGGNWLYAAAPGWDPTTGWGALVAPAFLAADANASVSGYNYTGPTPGLPPPLAVTYGGVSSWILLVIGVSIAVAIVLVVTVGRPRTPPPPVYSYPPGAYPGYSPPTGAGPPSEAWATPPSPLPPGPGPLSPPAPSTFLCPYCGSPRPAEPVRCPACGRL